MLCGRDPANGGMAACPVANDLRHSDRPCHSQRGINEAGRDHLVEGTVTCPRSRSTVMEHRAYHATGDVVIGSFG